jgi:hypothetical protein
VSGIRGVNRALALPFPPAAKIVHTSDALNVTLDGSTQITAHVQLGECLSAAKTACSDGEVAVLTAKRAGVPARPRDCAHPADHKPLKRGHDHLVACISQNGSGRSVVAPAEIAVEGQL